MMAMAAPGMDAAASSSATRRSTAARSTGGWPSAAAGAAGTRMAEAASARPAASRPTLLGRRFVGASVVALRGDWPVVGPDGVCSVIGVLHCSAVVTGVPGDAVRLPLDADQMLMSHRRTAVAFRRGDGLDDAGSGCRVAPVKQPGL